MPIHSHMLSEPDNRASVNPAVNQHLIAGKQAFLGYLRRRLGSLDEAEDVLQNFSLKVIRASQTASSEEKIDAWLGQIMRHTLIDHYRRRATRLRAETAYSQEQGLEEPATEADPAAGPCKCLPKALLRLGPDQAAILRRADLEEEPRTRIAADLGLTANALNVRLYRARHALRHELESTCPSCRDGSFLECACD
ncbi:MAG: RNA polymerase sigma factor [Paracoccaceae bacterium]|nr:RNA polymerase sigma factor [Paracoccaceae bacterium]